MRKSVIVAWTLGLALGLAACGDKGGSGGGGGGGVVGSWTVDVDALLGEATKAAEEQMQKALAAAPPEQREMMKGLMPSGDKLKDMIKAQAKEMEGVMTFRADGTCSMASASEDDKEVGEGTWTQSGETVTVKPTTKNGEAVSGEDAEPITLTFKGGKLSMKPAPEAPVIYFKRK